MTVRRAKRKAAKRPAAQRPIRSVGVNPTTKHQRVATSQKPVASRSNLFGGVARSGVPAFVDNSGIRPEVAQALLAARALLIERGWRTGESFSSHYDESSGPVTLLEALRASEDWVAVQEVRRLLEEISGEVHLWAWGMNPYNTAEDCLALVDKALHEAGIEIPPPKRRHGGGWIVSTGGSN